MQPMTRSVGAAIWALSSAFAIAQAADVPARLLVGEESIEELLRFPKDLPLGRYEVFCETLIRRNGSAARSYCYSKADAQSERLAEAVERAARAARYVPATRDGTRVNVYMVTMAIIAITPQEPLVLVVPNNGVEKARYGLLYTAPQRLNQFSWHDPTLDQVRLVQAHRDVLVWMRLSIDEHGKITDKGLTNASGAPALVVDAIDRHIDKMDFIPGHHDGKPVPMLYLEPSFSSDRPGWYVR